MNEDELRQAESEQIYHKLVGRFKNLKKKEVIIEYNPFSTYLNAGTFTIGIDSSKTGDEVKLGIEISPSFFYLTEKEKKVVMLHEQKHLEHLAKNCNLNRLRRIRDWYKELSEQIKKEQFWGYRLKNFDKEESHRLKRLQKWITLYELNADSEIIKAGYRKLALKMLKGDRDNPNLTFTPTSEQTLHARIKNLEEKLKVKNE